MNVQWTSVTLLQKVNNYLHVQTCRAIISKLLTIVQLGSSAFLSYKQHEEFKQVKTTGNEQYLHQIVYMNAFHWLENKI